MDNNSNNNLNGNVLGNINSNNPNNLIDDNIETLDSNVGINQEIFSSKTFFNPEVNNVNNVNNNVNLSQGGMTNQTIEMPNIPNEPTTAYTNPQMINPSPMPGFENSNAIGQTPPISLEPEKKPKKTGNKILFVILILVVLAGIGFGTWYVLKYTNFLNNHKSINIVTKDLELVMGESLSTDISYYANITGTDTKNCLLDISLVDINNVGTYNYKVTCGDIEKTGVISIIDNRELTINIKKLYITKNSSLEAKDFAKKENDGLTYEFVNREEVNTILAGDYGTYTVKLRVSDGNKTKEVDASLVLMEYGIKGYLICTSNEQNVDNAIMTVSEKFAIIDNQNKNSYGNVAYEIHNFKFTDETEYTNYLAQYNTNNTITINNITGDVKFDDENLTISITNELDNNKVINEYGESNLHNYSSIKSYFESTLKYHCVYNNRDI